MVRGLVDRKAATIFWCTFMLLLTAIPKHEARADPVQPPRLNAATQELVRLTQRRLMKRVTHCAPAQLPAGGALRIESTVTVEVKINCDGRVTSARAINGHPMLYQSVIASVRRWTFKPLMVSGQCRGFSGRLRFVLSTLERTTKSGCLNGF